jgi:diphthine methyl ester acylhydrolase
MPDLVAITTTEGKVHVVKLGDRYQNCDTSSRPVITHSLEAWHVAISPFVTPLSADMRCSGLGPDGLAFTMFSGADDSILQYATCILGKTEDGENSPLAVEVPFAPITVKGHNAGVTAILPLPVRFGDLEFLVTGSYDDHIRLYSFVPLHKTGGVQSIKLLAEQNLGGGVWRIKLISIKDQDKWEMRLLVSCMHAGVKIVELKQQNEETFAFSVLASFEEHKSMNYGSDYQPGSDAESGTRAVSVSFYDRMLFLWRIPVDQFPPPVGR